jgi:hypothetical protein
MRYYAENLCGYRHHEYDYKTNVSLHLTLALKFFIRLLTLSPVHMHQHVIREIHHESGQLECFDIGHVALIIASTPSPIRHEDESGADAGHAGPGVRVSPDDCAA